MLLCSNALVVAQPRMWRITVAVAGLLCSSTYVSAQPNKELQERCGKRAAEFFRREHSPPIAKIKYGQIRFNYENHYSTQLNKCFFLEVANKYESREGKPIASKIMRLVDLNDNKEYGTFVSGPTEPLACSVQDKGCRSESEWRQLLKPFMED
jgi:hypothetical protein